MPYLAQQLESLVKQEVPFPWELVFVDNGSTDASREVAEQFVDLVPMRIVSAPHPANLSHARNAGASAARADLLAFLDADDQLSPGWVRAMGEALQEHALVSGVNVPDVSLSTRAAAEARTGRPPAAMRAPEMFLPYAQGSSLGVQRRWFDAVGGFDLRLSSTGEDVAFSWLVQLAGGDLVLAPGAVGQYRARGGLGAAARQQFRTGRGQAMLYSQFASRGMRRATRREVFGRWATLLIVVPALPFSERLRGRWVGTLARRSGRISGSISERVVFL